MSAMIRNGRGLGAMLGRLRATEEEETPTTGNVNPASVWSRLVVHLRAAQTLSRNVVSLTSVSHIRRCQTSLSSVL